MKFIRRKQNSLGFRSKIRFAVALHESFATVSQRPVRTLLTVLGTIIGIASFVTINGIAETARAQVSARFDAVRATQVLVLSSNEDLNDVSLEFEDRLSRLNGVESSFLSFVLEEESNKLRPRSDPKTTAEAINSQVVGATPGVFETSEVTFSTGLGFNNFHNDARAKVAVIGRAVAEKLSISRVDNQPILFLGDDIYYVIGVIDSAVRNNYLLNSIVVPSGTAMENFAGKTKAVGVFIVTKPGAAKLIGRQAPIAINPNEPNTLRAEVPIDPVELREQISSDVTRFLFLVSAISLLIGTVSIANAVLLNVIERRKEIGLRRAMGATRNQIRNQIVFESSVMGFIASIVGLAIAMYIVVGVSLMNSWTPTIDLRVLLLSPILGIATGVVAGVIPARRAARTLPSETLRSQ